MEPSIYRIMVRGAEDRLEASTELIGASVVSVTSLMPRGVCQVGLQEPSTLWVTDR